ncbi:MAG: DUF3455 domain-containing protein [Gemmatimonadales bacterium]
MEVSVKKVRTGAFAIAAVLLAACGSESTTAPDGAVMSQPAVAASRSFEPGSLGTCDSLAVPAGSHLLAHYYASGDQIYFWEGQKWLFIGPDAILYRDRAGRRQVGVHQVAGVWESKDGSKVVGQVQRSCTPSSTAIAWQLLSVLGQMGPGIFARVDAIQRIRTEGGLPPVTPGTVYGQQVRSPYRAEYLFYRVGRQ